VRGMTPRCWVSELFCNSIRHSGSGAEGETVTIAVRAAGGVVRVEVTDRGGRGVPQLRASGGEAEGGRGLGLVAGLAALVGVAVAWWADGDLVRAAARLNLPCPGAGGMAGRAEVHGMTRQVHARSAPGTSEEILSGPSAEVLFWLSSRCSLGTRIEAGYASITCVKAIWGNGSCPRTDTAHCPISCH